MGSPLVHAGINALQTSFDTGSYYTLRFISQLALLSWSTVQPRLTEAGCGAVCRATMLRLQPAAQCYAWGRLAADSEVNLALLDRLMAP